MAILHVEYHGYSYKVSPSKLFNKFNLFYDLGNKLLNNVCFQKLSHLHVVKPNLYL